MGERVQVNLTEIIILISIFIAALFLCTSFISLIFSIYKEIYNKSGFWEALIFFPLWPFLPLYIFFKLKDKKFVKKNKYALIYFFTGIFLVIMSSIAIDIFNIDTNTTYTF